MVFIVMIGTALCCAGIFVGGYAVGKDAARDEYREMVEKLMADYRKAIRHDRMKEWLKK